MAIVLTVCGYSCDSDNVATVVTVCVAVVVTVCGYSCETVCGYSCDSDSVWLQL